MEETGNTVCNQRISVKTGSGLFQVPKASWQRCFSSRDCEEGERNGFAKVLGAAVADIGGG